MGFSLSGTFTLTNPTVGADVAGIIVTLVGTGGHGTYSSSASDSGGNFVVNTPEAPYSGIFSASKVNYVFAANGSTIGGSLAQDGFDTTVTYVPPATVFYSVSGSVFVSGTSTPIQYMTMSMHEISGSNTLSTLYTDANGNYSASLPASRSFYLLPTHSIYTMSPVTKSFYSMSANLNNQIFSASLITWMVWGTIYSSSGFPTTVPFITISSSLGNNTIANASGVYSASFTQSANVTLMPTSSIYTFSPGRYIYTNITASQYYQNYIATPILPPMPGLGHYYDSRKKFDSGTSTWYDVVSASAGVSASNIIAGNTYYAPSKDLLFGSSFYGDSSASFYGTQVSSSFAMEFWLAPFTSSTSETIVSSVLNTYPSIQAYLTGSQVVVSYQQTISSPIVTARSYNISRAKYNHIVFFTSQSNLYVWSNGLFYESASVNVSRWNGGVLGINSALDNNPYKGFIDVVKIWNATNINLSTVNSFYGNRNYWADLASAVEPPAPTQSALPTDYPNLQGWYPQNGLIIGGPGGGWLQWNDMSGNGNNVPNVGGPGEVYILNGALVPPNTPGSNAYANCNSSTYFGRTCSGSEFVSSSYTFITVTGYYPGQGDSGGSVVLGFNGSINVQMLIDYTSPTNSLGMYATDGTSTPIYGHGPLSASVFAITAGTLDATTGTVKTYQNGTTATSVLPGFVPTTYNGTIRLGRGGIMVSDIIIYQDVKTPAVINALCDSISTQYNIPWIHV